jgi:hypothetical protein
MQVTYILLKIEHSAPIPELTDLAAGRVYTMNHVEDVTATLLDEAYFSKTGIDKALTSGANRE